MPFVLCFRRGGRNNCFCFSFLVFLAVENDAVGIVFSAGAAIRGLVIFRLVVFRAAYVLGVLAVLLPRIMGGGLMCHDPCCSTRSFHVLHFAVHL